MRSVHGLKPDAYDHEAYLKALGGFSQYARTLTCHGIPCFPAWGDDGKCPLISGYSKGKLPTLDTIDQWSNQYPDANCAIHPGRANLVICDIENEEYLSWALSTHGETPLIISSPKGGLHLWYRQNITNPVQFLDYRSLNNSIEGELRTGNSAIVIAAGVNPETGGVYSFYQGNFECIPDLPVIRDIERPSTSKRPKKPSKTLFTDSNTSNLNAPNRLNPIGTRNTQLFNVCMVFASHLVNFGQLLEFAHWYNQNCHVEPEEDTKVTATAKSVWGYTENNNNWIAMAERKQSDGVNFTESDRIHLNSHPNGGHAMWLEFNIRTFFFEDHKPFPIAARAMQDSGNYDKLTERKIITGRTALLELQRIIQINTPRKYRVNLYMWNNI